MLPLASTHHDLRRTFLGELVMVVPDVPVRASGRRRNAAASVLRLASTDPVLPRHMHRNTRENRATGDETIQGKSCKLGRQLLRPPNVLTLSCKSRLTCLPQEAARRLPRLTPEWQERTAADVTHACSSKPPQGGFAAGPTDRRFLSACEGS
jgi:hypothetical protein